MRGEEKRGGEARGEEGERKTRKGGGYDGRVGEERRMREDEKGSDRRGREGRRGGGESLRGE